MASAPDASIIAVSCLPTGRTAHSACARPFLFFLGMVGRLDPNQAVANARLKRTLDECADWHQTLDLCDSRQIQQR